MVGIFEPEEVRVTVFAELVQHKPVADLTLTNKNTYFKEKW